MRDGRQMIISERQIKKFFSEKPMKNVFRKWKESKWYKNTLDEIVLDYNEYIFREMVVIPKDKIRNLFPKRIFIEILEYNLKEAIVLEAIYLRTEENLKPFVKELLENENFLIEALWKIYGDIRDKIKIEYC